MFELGTAVLTMQVPWDITLCRLANLPGDSYKCRRDVGIPDGDACRYWSKTQLARKSVMTAKCSLFGFTAAHYNLLRVISLFVIRAARSVN